MKLSKFPRGLVTLAVILTLLAGLGFSLALGQSRRQPPTSNEKKNKRPPEPGQQQGEKPDEPLPPDLTGKPQDAEKITVSTQIVNVDTVVYHKKSGQIVAGLKKENFSIMVDGAPMAITQFLNAGGADHRRHGGRVQQVVGGIRARRGRRLGPRHV